MPRQLLLLLRRLEDHASLAEPDDVLLHQVQVDQLHELLRGQRAGREPAADGELASPVKASKPGVQDGAGAKAEGCVQVCVRVCVGWVCTHACVSMRVQAAPGPFQPGSAAGASSPLGSSRAVPRTQAAFLPR